MKRTTAIISATLLTTGAVAAPAVFAQEAAPQSGAAAQSAPAQQNFSDQQLQDFASASQEIASISQSYTDRLQSAGSDEDQVRQVREEANEKMVQAVQDSGLQVEEFNQIGQAIQQDPELLQRVQAMVQEQ
ncbi:DUF4168 domain-containing protein [Halotalea alkalilenta]|uniref:DUF4168 domain-containing protein n=1 Tax=Halotalea alkalilenta TaxID=376489 RepID=A0A172YGU3_9GAMM|nr:DUF4168 domain-containing protein [Halotalea alkalilenta]ANF58488.1 hypothetical protein A5892_14235 [Halotalea alkalilenta]